MPQQFVFKLLSKCNIACTYCYQEPLDEGNWKSKFKTMSTDTFRRSLEAALAVQEAGPARIAVNLQGGEPLLVGKKKFNEYLKICKELKSASHADIAISIQTNGLLIDKEWIELFRIHDVKIGISLDGPPDYHDQHRVYFGGKGTGKDVEASIRMIKQAGLKVHTITVANSKFSGKKVLQYFSSLEIDNVHLLLPAENYHTLNGRKKPFYGRYLTEMFDEWLSSNNRSNIIDFEGVVKALGGFTFGPWILNGQPSEWICFLPDGSVEKGDPYGICESGSFALESVNDSIRSQMKSVSFLNHLIPEQNPTDECKKCEFSKSCSGGFPTFRFSTENGFKNKSVFCEDTLYFYRHVSMYLLRMSAETA